MRKSVRQIYEAIQNKEYVGCNTKASWGGADLIIAQRDNRKLKEAREEYGKVTVITKYAKELVWFIELVKGHLSVDYIQKYEFYPSLGRFWNAYMESHEAEAFDIRDMFINTLFRISEYLQCVSESQR